MCTDTVPHLYRELVLPVGEDTGFELGTFGLRVRHDKHCTMIRYEYAFVFNIIWSSTNLVTFSHMCKYGHDRHLSGRLKTNEIEN